MKYIYLKTSNPFLNLSTEEFLAKHTKESLFLIYRNQPCVIIGKNQNPHSETNLAFLKSHHIDLIRRNSGGGAVYQDLNNLNFSFILQNKKDDFCNFKKYSQPIIDCLNKLTTKKVYFSGRNDILIDNKKISGTAQMVVGNNLVHHGTILFDSDFSQINQILLANNDKLKFKGVKSVISRVTNLKPYLGSKLNIDDIVQALINDISNGIEYKLSPQNHLSISQASKQKKDKIKFLVNHNKQFMIKNSQYFPGIGTIEVCLNLDSNNTIAEAKIFTEHFSKANIENFTNKLIGIKYNRESIEKIINQQENINMYFNRLSKAKIINLILNQD